MDIHEYIKNLSLKDKKTLSQKTLKITEELGELSRVVLPFDSAHGTHHRFIDKNLILEELVDIYLANISILHSMGFSDDEFNDMLINKAKKWSELQTKEEKAEFPLPFEIHISIDCQDETDKDGNIKRDSFISSFKSSCSDINVKPIIIDLEINDGSIIKDVMTSSKHFGDNRTAYEESERISNHLKSLGYNVVRKKIETVPWHPAAPIEVEKEIENGCYYESHIGVVIDPEQKESLKLLISEIDLGKGRLKLSQNFFKKSLSGKYVNMLTYRNNACGSVQFQKDVEFIKNVLLENGFTFEKVEVEYALYDTNVTHDYKWIN